MIVEWMSEKMKETKCTSHAVRNCQTKTTPCVEKKDLLKAQTAGLPPSGSECSSLAGMGRGLYRRGHTMREGGCSSQRTAWLLASAYM
jgi:hypothetical protein